MKKPKPSVVEVTTEGFELSDRRFYPHHKKLPVLQEFKAIMTTGSIY